ncbi:MAG: hypothetical protein IJW64_06965 [Clostridia bacterium]|nr:hypothetical protein [Clostridia bacterium]
MDNLIKTLSETVGFPTIISATVVCLIMMIVKKIKPKISPKTELIIRIIVSVLVRVAVILVTKGDFSCLIETSLNVCGVSLIICAIFNKNSNAQELKEMVSAFLPNIADEKIDEIFSAMPDSQEISKDGYNGQGDLTLTAQSKRNSDENHSVSG